MSTPPLGSARHAVYTLAELVAERLPPGLTIPRRPDTERVRARRGEVASMLHQLAMLLPDALPLSVAELEVAFEELGSGRCLARDLRDRQILCQQLAALCREHDGEPTQAGISQAIERATEVWRLWAMVLDVRDPRQAAYREELELELEMLECTTLRGREFRA